MEKAPCLSALWNAVQARKFWRGDRRGAFHSGGRPRGLRKAAGREEYRPSPPLRLDVAAGNPPSARGVGRHGPGPVAPSPALWPSQGKSSQQPMDPNGIVNGIVPVTREHGRHQLHVPEVQRRDEAHPEASVRHAARSPSAQPVAREFDWDGSVPIRGGLVANQDRPAGRLLLPKSGHH